MIIADTLAAEEASTQVAGASSTHGGSPRSTCSTRSGMAAAGAFGRSPLPPALVMVVLLLAASWVQPACAQTAYIIPSLQQDNPSNHSYSKLGKIIANQGLVSSYDVIMLTTDYRIDPDLFPHDEPIALHRNLTITSANFRRDGYSLLELEFQMQRLLIPQGFSLTLKNLALGRARQTSGQGLPFFVGEGEHSLLLLDNVVRIRTACAHNEPELISTLQSIARREHWGTNTTSQGKQQRVRLLPSFTFRGKAYEDSIYADDLWYFVGPVDVPDTNYYAGYSMRHINTVRICETYVSDECVLKRGADVCVEEQTVALTALTVKKPPAQQPGGSSANNLAAIVAPTVVCGSLLLVGALAAAALLHRRQLRKARLETSKQSLLPVTDKGSSGDGGGCSVGGGGSGCRRPGSSGGGSGGGGGTGGSDSDGSPVRDVGSGGEVVSIPGPYSGANGSIEHLALGNRAGSWQLAAFHTAPEFEDASPHDKLSLGVLLGAGSFARVYQGFWRQQDVAVKVLQHDSNTAAAISNEVDLVMSFRHDNIVAAFYYLTWTRSQEHQQQLQQQQQQQQRGLDTRSSDQATARQDSLRSNTSTSAAAAAVGGAAAGGGVRGSTQLEPVVEASSSNATSRQSDSASQHQQQQQQQHSSGALVVADGSSGNVSGTAAAAAAAFGNNSPNSSNHSNAAVKAASMRNSGASNMMPEQQSSRAAGGVGNTNSSYDGCSGGSSSTSSSNCTGEGGTSFSFSVVGATASSSSAPRVFDAAINVSNHSGSSHAARPAAAARVAAAAATAGVGSFPMQHAPAAGSHQRMVAADARSFGGAAAMQALHVQQQQHHKQPMPTFVPMLPAALHASSSFGPGSFGSTGATSADHQHSREAAGYAISNRPSSSSRNVYGGAVARDAVVTCSGSQAGNTSSSLIAAAYGNQPQHQQQQQQQSQAHQHHVQQQQQQEQQPLKVELAQQQQQQPSLQPSQQPSLQPSQQQQHVRFTPVSDPSSAVMLPSSPVSAAGQSVSGGPWHLHTTVSSPTSSYVNTNTRAAGQHNNRHSLSSVHTVPTASPSSSSNVMHGGGSKASKSDEAFTLLILEFCNGGTLLDLFAEEDGPLSPEQLVGRRRLGPVLTLLVDIAAGMSYLHSRNVLHGDLKPGNVLIKHVQGAPYCRVAKVADFGLSRALQAGQSHRSTRTFGTLNHTSPELLRLGRLSPAGDVYAFGIVMWELFVGEVAFSGLHYGEVFEQVALLQRRPDIPPGMPPDYAELMQQCWAADPLLRPAFTTVQQRLESMLASLLQDEAEAQERFVSDL